MYKNTRKEQVKKEKEKVQEGRTKGRKRRWRRRRMQREEEIESTPQFRDQVRQGNVEPNNEDKKKLPNK